MEREGLGKRVGAEMDRLAGGGAVVVGVSGGGDSVALLLLLHGWAGPGRGLVVAHLNHGVRGAQADEEERFVAGLAGGLGREFEGRGWKPERAGHFEADARQARYGWLVEVARRRGAAVVAVGHTRDDQAETILHRILRGTGPEGLGGMAESRELAEGVKLVRPLLGFSRAELRAHLRAIGQAWREDPSNDDRSRTRARIRHELIPSLEAAFNPRVVAALARLGKLARAERMVLDAALARLEREIGREGEGIVMDREGLRALGEAERRALLRRAWRRQGWPEREMTETRWGRLARFLEGGAGRMDVGGGIEALVSGDRVVVGPRSANGEPEGARELPVPGGVEWVGGRIEARVGEPERGEAIDRDRVEGALWVGPPGEGERFDPLGMGGKTQPLADFLRGRKIPRADRPGVPVVRDRAGIVWVAGHRIAHRVRRTDETRNILCLNWHRGGTA